MRQTLICVLALLLASCRFGVETPTGKPRIDRLVFTIHSWILQEDREIHISLPHTQHPIWMDARGQFGVAYLLDGASHFDVFNSIQRSLSSDNLNADCPSMIVVGLMNTDRTRDLTPTRDTSEVEANGGGEAYLRFIREEVFPFVDSVCHPGKYRMLVGHGYGGLLTLHALTRHPKMFNSYVVMEPTLSWDGLRFLDTTLKLLAAPKYAHKSLCYVTANTAYTDLDYDEIAADTSAVLADIRTGMRLGDSLNELKENGLTWSGRYMGGENFASLPVTGIRFALRQIFFDYEFWEQDTLLQVDPRRGLQIVLNQHAAISKKMGADPGGLENKLNEIAYWLMRKKEYSRAKEFFGYNLAHFPQSPDAYDSMGECLQNLGDESGAETMRRKSQKLQKAAEKALYKLISPGMFGS